MERMTVKEASEALGLSKNTIMYRLSKLPPEMHIKEDGKIYIFEDGIRALSKWAKPSREKDYLPESFIDEPRVRELPESGEPFALLAFL